MKGKQNLINVTTLIPLLFTTVIGQTRKDMAAMLPAIINNGGRTSEYNGAEFPKIKPTARAPQTNPQKHKTNESHLRWLIPCQLQNNNIALHRHIAELAHKLISKMDLNISAWIA